MYVCAYITPESWNLVIGGPLCQDSDLNLRDIYQTACPDSYQTAQVEVLRESGFPPLLRRKIGGPTGSSDSCCRSDFGGVRTESKEGLRFLSKRGKESRIQTSTGDLKIVKNTAEPPKVGTLTPESWETNPRKLRKISS